MNSYQHWAGFFKPQIVGSQFDVKQIIFLLLCLFQNKHTNGLIWYVWFLHGLFLWTGLLVYYWPWVWLTPWSSRSLRQTGLPESGRCEDCPTHPPPSLASATDVGSCCRPDNGRTVCYASSESVGKLRLNKKASRHFRILRYFIRTYSFFRILNHQKIFIQIQKDLN